MNNNSYINIRLLDIVSISRESVKEFDGIKKYLSTGDLDFDKIVNLEDITWENKPSRANQLVKENDVLFAKMKDTKKTLIIDDAKKDLIVSTGFYVLTVSEKIMPKYLYYFLSSEIFLRDKNKLCKGATQKALNNEGLSKIKILLPNLNLQYKTIDILDKAKNLIDKRKLQLEYLDELVKSKFIEMFGDPVHNPLGWELKPFLESGSCKNGMNFSSNESGIELQYLGVGDFKDLSKIDNVNALGKVSLNQMPSKEYILQDGDIVFVRSNGNKALVGRCLAVYPNGVATTYSGFCIRYRKTDENLEIAYLLQVLKTDSIRKNMAGRGANIQNLNQQILGELMIPVPPLELQKQFTDFIKQVDKLKFEMEKSLKQLEDNFNSLMQRAFKGELFN